jgi:hypothetical protein
MSLPLALTIENHQVSSGLFRASKKKQQQDRAFPIPLSTGRSKGGRGHCFVSSLEPLGDTIPQEDN